MRIDCLHGYYRFEETGPGQLSQFSSRFGIELARAASGDHFTFADLVEAPDYSLGAGTFLGIPTLEFLEGTPWDIMRANGLVYNFTTGLVQPIATIAVPVQVEQSGHYFISSGMLLAGSVREDGSRVMDYSAFYNADRFKYSEITYG